MYVHLAAYYDLIHAALDEDIGFLLTMAAEVGGPVLELGSGTGRLVLPFARAGFQITGVDNEPAMLSIARRRLAAEPEVVRKKATLVEADIRNISFFDDDVKFNLVLLPYNNLLHLKPGEIKEVLRRLRSHLPPNGRLFIDIENPYNLGFFQNDPQPVLENMFKDPQTGQMIYQYSQSRLDAYRQVLQTTWIFREAEGTQEPSGVTTVDVIYYYQYPHQLELILKGTGYSLLQLLGNYSGDPFTEESERLLLLASPS